MVKREGIPCGRTARPFDSAQSLVTYRVRLPAHLPVVNAKARDGVSPSRARERAGGIAKGAGMTLYPPSGFQEEMRRLMAMETPTPTAAAMRAIDVIAKESKSTPIKLCREGYAAIIDAEFAEVVLLARLALQPYGAFSRDRLTMANNCIAELAAVAAYVLRKHGVAMEPLTQDEYDTLAEAVQSAMPLRPLPTGGGA